MGEYRVGKTLVVYSFLDAVSTPANSSDFHVAAPDNACRFPANAPKPAPNCLVVKGSKMSKPEPISSWRAQFRILDVELWIFLGQNLDFAQEYTLPCRLGSADCPPGNEHSGAPRMVAGCWDITFLWHGLFLWVC